MSRIMAAVVFLAFCCISTLASAAQGAVQGGEHEIIKRGTILANQCLMGNNPAADVNALANALLRNAVAREKMQVRVANGDERKKLTLQVMLARLLIDPSGLDTADAETLGRLKLFEAINAPTAQEKLNMEHYWHAHMLEELVEEVNEFGLKSSLQRAAINGRFQALNTKHKFITDGATYKKDLEKHEAYLEALTFLRETYDKASGQARAVKLVEKRGPSQDTSDHGAFVIQFTPAGEKGIRIAFQNLWAYGSQGGYGHGVTGSGISRENEGIPDPSLKEKQRLDQAVTAAKADPSKLAQAQKALADFMGNLPRLRRDYYNNRRLANIIGQLKALATEVEVKKGDVDPKGHHLPLAAIASQEVTDEPAAIKIRDELNGGAGAKGPWQYKIQDTGVNGSEPYKNTELFKLVTFYRDDLLEFVGLSDAQNLGQNFQKGRFLPLIFRMKHGGTRFSLNNVHYKWVKKVSNEQVGVVGSNIKPKDQNDQATQNAIAEQVALTRNLLDAQIPWNIKAPNDLLAWNFVMGDFNSPDKLPVDAVKDPYRVGQVLTNGSVVWKGKPILATNDAFYVSYNPEVAAKEANVKMDVPPLSGGVGGGPAGVSADDLANMLYTKGFITQQERKNIQDISDKGGKRNEIKKYVEGYLQRINVLSADPGELVSWDAKFNTIMNGQDEIFYEGVKLFPELKDEEGRMRDALHLAKLIDDVEYVALMDNYSLDNIHNFVKKRLISAYIAVYGEQDQAVSQVEQDLENALTFTNEKYLNDALYYKNWLEGNTNYRFPDLSVPGGGHQLAQVGGAGMQSAPWQQPQQVQQGGGQFGGQQNVPFPQQQQQQLHQQPSGGFWPIAPQQHFQQHMMIPPQQQQFPQGGGQFGGGQQNVPFPQQRQQFPQGGQVFVGGMQPTMGMQSQQQVQRPPQQFPQGGGMQPPTGFYSIAPQPMGVMQQPQHQFQQQVQRPPQQFPQGGGMQPPQPQLPQSQPMVPLSLPFKPVVVTATIAPVRPPLTWNDIPPKKYSTNIRRTLETEVAAGRLTLRQVLSYPTPGRQGEQDAQAARILAEIRNQPR